MERPLIHLHYIWFKKYGCYENQRINLSPKYNFSYAPQSNEISVTKNKEYIDGFFGKNIDVTAIVGQNGTGKTTLLQFISKLKSGDFIETECVIVCEIDSKFWAGRYIQENNQITHDELPIKGLPENKCLYYYPLDNRRSDESRFPFGSDMRFIYMTEMFNPSQYAPSYAGCDDLSVAGILYDQTTNGEEEKHIQNPVVKYIHRITDRQLEFLSKGRDFVEQFHINYPQYISIFPSYDAEALAKLYYEVEFKEKIPSSPNNDRNYEIANTYSNRLLRTSLKLKDEYSKAILMNIISSFGYYTNMTYENKEQLLSLINRCYVQDASLWDKTINLLNEIYNSNEEYNQWLNSKRGKKPISFHVDAKPYIEFMKCFSKILDEQSRNNDYDYRVYISTQNFKYIKTFHDSYKKCTQIVDFLSFSWGLSSGENLLLNQYGKLMHLLKYDSNKGEYYLPKDVNSDNSVSNAVIMLDEAEVSFHPEWQRIYFNAILEFIKANICSQETHVQIIIATHSPIILSDIPKQNTVFLKRADNGSTICVEGEETFAANIFSLYRNAFFLSESEIGAFAESKLCQLVANIHDLFNQEDYPSETPKNELLQQIKLIGDPYIRRKFEVEYQHCKAIHDSKYKIICERIAEKEQELEALKRQLKDSGE